MEILTNVGAVVAGIALVTVGAFSLIAIWFDDLP